MATMRTSPLRRVALVAATAVLLAALGAMPGSAASIVHDSGFEATEPPADNPNWTAIYNTASPICSVDHCGETGGYADPHSGENWLWFGGYTEPSDASVAQNVLIPDTGKAVLSFWLLIGGRSGNGTDRMRILIDDTDVVFEVLENTDGYNEYARRAVVIDAYADGAVHTLTIESSVAGSDPPTDFSVDDVAITATGVLPPGTSCAGKPVTRPGTSASETIRGTAGNDVISGGAGNDVILGNGGNDRICSGKGNDTVVGGAGRDTLQGGAGADVLRGGRHADQLSGGGGHDRLKGAEGADLLLGGSGDDRLDGGGGTRDECVRSIGRDTTVNCEQFSTAG